jgi:hypothetical protein
MKNFCAFCEHFLGGGDWGTSCSVQYDLCYEHHEACEHFKEDYLRKQAFKTGIWLYQSALRNQKPKTNADMLRAKSDEGLEEWYWWMHKEMMNYTDSRVFVHEWLKQEVNE